MSPDHAAPIRHEEIVVGNACLLSILGTSFMVRILEVRDDNIAVTFPGRDYPIEEMTVSLAFHDEEGFNEYHVQVVKGPEGDRNGILLTRPRVPIRNQHRIAVRVATDLTVQVKDQAHIRQYDAALLNIGTGGALIRTVAPFDFSTTVELNLSLPEEIMQNLTAQVVHMAESSDPIRGGERVYGLEFFGLDPSVAQTISLYVWNQLRNIHASEF